MSVPIIPVQVNLPPEGNQPKTYGDYLDMMNCSCVVGALVMPSPFFSGFLDLGSLLADVLKFLGVFTSIYKIIARILKIIACIIEIFCALMNPFKTIAAIVKFFMICMPELLELFPQFAILLFIICLIKIILSIIIYILTVLIPLIADIVHNILEIKRGIEEGNVESYMAIAFKLTSLFEELRSLLGILALLAPILDMIKTLLAMGMGIPCHGKEKDDPECPTVFDDSTYSGSDGILSVVYKSDKPLDYKITFSSQSNKNALTGVKDFFPSGVNYDNIDDVLQAPYSIKFVGNKALGEQDGYYSVTSTNKHGEANLQTLSQSENTDGYLSSVVMIDGYKYNILDPEARLGTPSGTFSHTDVGNYVIMSDARAGHGQNSGTWEITQVYDAKNVKLTLVDLEGKWLDARNTLTRNPSVDAHDYIYWNLAPYIPSPGSSKKYVFTINFEELIRRNVLSVGCHPAIKASIQATADRFPEITTDPNLGLPPEAVLPDVNSLIVNINAAVDKVCPKNADTNYILAHYPEIELALPALYPEIESLLGAFQDDCLTYVKYVLPRVVNPELSILDANPKLQLVGEPININIAAYDRSGDRLGKGLPPGLVTAEAFTSAGNISSTVEVLDSNGAVNGDFAAVLNSDIPLKANITASVLGRFISDFNGSVLVPRVVQVEFVEPSELARRRTVSDTSPEPLGVGRKE